MGIGRPADSLVPIVMNAIVAGMLVAVVWVGVASAMALWLTGS
ncbi:MAG: hypothetical protein ABI724_01130 [Betaproteobacteria bacterium]